MKINFYNDNNVTIYRITIRIVNDCCTIESTESVTSIKSTQPATDQKHNNSKAPF